MGLTNASQQFQMMMEDRLKGVRDIADPFIDDIIIGTQRQPGQTREELLAQHDRDIRRVMGVLKEDRLIADVRKCHFFVDEVEFCGHILGLGPAAQRRAN